MDNLFYAKVVKQISEYSYLILPADGGSNLGDGYVATVLSPIPTGKSGGFKSAPGTIDNLFALCAKSGRAYFILGFTPVAFGNTGVTARSNTTNDSGGFSLGTPDGTHVKAYADGSLGLFTDAYSQIVLEPRSQSIYAQFRSMVMKWWSGRLSVTTLGNDSVFDFYFAKSLDLTPLPTHKMDRKPNAFWLSVGNLSGSDSILRWSTEERYNAAGVPEFVAKGTLGVDSGIAMHAESASVSLTTKSSLDWLENGGIKYHVDNGTNNIDLLVDSTVNDVVKLSVGNKAVITIGADGTTTLRLTDGAFLYLGGKDKGQRLVTEAWVNQRFDNHMHPTATPGPPSIPLPMPAPPATGDAKTNLFTYTTLAE
jgi:hypothetical protein